MPNKISKRTAHKALGLPKNAEVLSVTPVKYLVTARVEERGHTTTTTHTVEIS